MARKRTQIIEHIQVIDLGDKGRAIGRAADGRIVLVERAVPGDVVHGKVVKRKKGMKIVLPTEYLEYSAERTEPVCAHFGTCGGCKWQNFDYSAQLRHKEKAVRDALERIAHLEDPLVEPILGCNDSYLYRNKLEFTFTDQRWLTEEEISRGGELDRNGLGFHVPGSFSRVLDIRECHLQPAPSNGIRNRIRTLAPELGLTFQNIRDRSGHLRNVIVRNNEQGEVMVIVVFANDDPPMREELLRSLAEEFPQIVSLYYCINRKLNDSLFDQEMRLFAGHAKLRMQLGHIYLDLGPKSFFQTNTRQARKLYDVAAEMADITADDQVLDLYCGIGSIGLYLARDARQVVGVEEVGAAVEDAQLNATLNDISNIQFIAGDARHVMASDAFLATGAPDVLVTDPPRAGMHADVVASIMDLAPRTIVYVSCNPSTQARDISILSDRYAFAKCRPVDMFPHTSHIENVALLKLKN